MITVDLSIEQLEVIRFALADRIEWLHDDCKNYDGTEEGELYWSEFHLTADVLRAVADAAKQHGIETT